MRVYYIARLMSINIVIPMAGLGSRFAKEGYEKPKPFIDVKGKMMIERVLDNLAYPNARYILIARKEHLENRGDDIAKIKSRYNVEFTSVDKLTDGAACTVFAAAKYANNSTPMLIANSDQIIDIAVGDFIDDCKARELDGSILCFEDSDPKWSFARVDSNGIVQEVREKNPISNLATVGIYLFSQGNYFFDASLEMIAQSDKTNGEYYVAPTYNYMAERGLKAGVYNIAIKQMHGTGTPDDLDAYLKLI
jgi:UDP-N-acetylglucosamine diphosphorylase / glucose-1-phosphate thymidylyltransferase / UDP-N-acetylgalactosamine diphosphorylase / glucosamine-1-phosphate N-acetyltransferase / galactosamine-1-phosphate N-acetyltransferase